MKKISSFIEEGQWYKGNTHLHTTVSDGLMIPEQAVDRYRDAGYSFLAVTDHWKYGIYSDLQTDDFIMFGGVELDRPLTGTLGFCHHVTFMAVPEETSIGHGQDLTETFNKMDMQKIIDYMASNGHIAIYAHPRWSHVKMEEFDNIQGCIGLEIYNNICEIDVGCGESISYYERCLWQNKKTFCFASDDAHGEEHYLGGYIVVKAKSLTHENIMDSIKKGSFYASDCGPEISDFYIEDGIAHIDCSPCASIAFYSDGSPGINNTAEKALLSQASWNTTKSWRPSNYVYAVCTDAKGHRSWTQPIRL